MKKFSERMGFTKPQVILLNAVSATLRNSLWNFVLDYLRQIAPTQLEEAIDMPNRRRNFIENLARSFFRVPVDGVPVRGETDWLREKFLNLSWYEVYDFFEFLIQNERYFKGQLPLINQILEKENAGYRLINNQFVPITNEQEMQAIEEAIGKAAQFAKGANKNLSQAVALFSKRPDPDYRNSIKESVSAMESLVKQLSGKDVNFKPALKELSKKLGLHTALGESISNLYGYASDEPNIRHGSPEESNVDFDETKFILVECSAIVNFLTSKAQKAGLLKEG